LTRCPIRIAESCTFVNVFELWAAFAGRSVRSAVMTTRASGWSETAAEKMRNCLLTKFICVESNTSLQRKSSNRCDDSVFTTEKESELVRSVCTGMMAISV
jgi:hypothetical protein